MESCCYCVKKVGEQRKRRGSFVEGLLSPSFSSPLHYRKKRRFAFLSPQRSKQVTLRLLAHYKVVPNQKDILPP